MHTQPITIDKAEARDLYRSYKKHKHYSAPMDAELQRIYQLIAQGRVIIRAISGIVAAGLYPAGHPYSGLPKLALCRASASKCHWRPTGGGGTFYADASWRRAFVDRITIPGGSWPELGMNNKWNHEATPPQAPIHLRPKRGLENYHVMWEAEWKRVPPADPMLLRRIGKSDAWLVVAAWDLTEAEKAVMATRL